MTSRAADSPGSSDDDAARTGPRGSLAARMFAASAAIAVIVAIVFAVLLVAIASLRSATEREAEARRVTEETLALQRLVLDLETRVRGYALTNDERFLSGWANRRSQLPGRTTAFMRLTTGGAREADARRIVRLVNDYVSDYLEPLRGIAADNPELASDPDARSEGRERSDEIEMRFEEFLDAENARANESAAAATRRARRAIGIGIAGLVASAGLILFLGAYLARSVGRPLREVAAGATRIARGDFALRLPERGAGEVGRLTRAFNAMAGQLATRQRKLEEQNEQLRRSEAVKSELVSIVSHEVRTPLASVLGFTSLLLQRDVDPESRRRYLEIIDAQGKRLTALLDEFLDVQRIDEGKLELVKRRFDLAPLLREQVQLFSAAGEGNHAVTLEIEEEPLIVRGDPGRLTQVIANLLSNAIKYSPDGGRVEVLGKHANGGVRVTVRDEGIGIPETQHDQIFTKFFRGDAAASGITGTGLGLAFARAVVEAHGGRIDFSSKPGEGSTFWVDLPGRTEAGTDAARQ